MVTSLFTIALGLTGPSWLGSLGGWCCRVCSGGKLFLALHLILMGVSGQVLRSVIVLSNAAGAWVGLCAFLIFFFFF